MASRPPLCVARAASAAGAPANAVELEDLVDIIKAVDTSDVVEMELTGKKFSMTVKKQEALQAVAEPTYVQAPVASATPENSLRSHDRLQRSDRARAALLQRMLCTVIVIFVSVSCW